MYPKEFIQVVFINELAEIVENKPYISFSIMAIGFEFLGKALNTKEKDWNRGNPKKDFERSIIQLDSLKDYRPLLVKFRLWDSLRNGFSHSFVPKATLTLSSKRNPDQHLAISSNGKKINLKCEELYADFKEACNEIIALDFAPNDKMNRDLLIVSSST